MERKNDSTILLLLAAGLGVYWLTRKKASAVVIPKDEFPKSTQPIIDEPISVTPIMDEPIYSKPIFKETVIEQPIYEQPIYNEPIYTQPIYEQPIYNEPIYTQPIYDQPIYVAPINEQSVQNVEFTPVTDMFNTVWAANYDNKSVIDPVFNMNIEPL